MWPHLLPLAEQRPRTPARDDIKLEPPDISPSILGQASTAVAEDRSDPIIDMDDVDGTVEHIFRSVRGEDPSSIVMKEKIEAKEALLMDGMLTSDLWACTPGPDAQRISSFATRS